MKILFLLLLFAPALAFFFRQQQTQRAEQLKKNTNQVATRVKILSRRAAKEKGTSPASKGNIDITTGKKHAKIETSGGDNDAIETGELFEAHALPDNDEKEGEQTVPSVIPQSADDDSEEAKQLQLVRQQLEALIKENPELEEQMKAMMENLSPEDVEELKTRAKNLYNQLEAVE